MIVGISTFLVVLESSHHRIACEFSEEWAHRYLLVSQSEPANRPCGCRIPASPLRAGEVSQLKPSSPLWVRNGCFWRVLWPQRCCRFQRLLFMGEQW